MGLKAIIFILLLASIYLIQRDNFRIVRETYKEIFEKEKPNQRSRREIDDEDYAEWLAVSSTHPAPSEKSPKPHKILLSNQFSLNGTVSNHKIYTFSALHSFALKMKIDTPIPETSKNDEKLLKIPTLLSIISEKPAILASFLFQRTEDGLKHCALNTGIPSDVYKRVLRMIMVEKCAKMNDFEKTIHESIRTNMVDPSDPCVAALIHAVEKTLRSLSREHRALPENFQDFVTSALYNYQSHSSYCATIFNSFRSYKSTLNIDSVNNEDFSREDEYLGLTTQQLKSLALLIDHFDHQHRLLPKIVFREFLFTFKTGSRRQRRHLFLSGSNYWRISNLQKEMKGFQDAVDSAIKTTKTSLFQITDSVEAISSSLDFFETRSAVRRGYDDKEAFFSCLRQQGQFCHSHSRHFMALLYAFCVGSNPYSEDNCIDLVDSDLVRVSYQGASISEDDNSMDAIIDLEIQIPLDLKAYYQINFEFLPILTRMGNYGIVKEPCLEDHIFGVNETKEGSEVTNFKKKNCRTSTCHGSFTFLCNDADKIYGLNEDSQSLPICSRPLIQTEVHSYHDKTCIVTTENRVLKAEGKNLVNVAQEDGITCLPHHRSISYSVAVGDMTVQIPSQQFLSPEIYFSLDLATRFASQQTNYLQTLIESIEAPEFTSWSTFYENAKNISVFSPNQIFSFLEKGTNSALHALFPSFGDSFLSSKFRSILVKILSVILIYVFIKEIIKKLLFSIIF